MSSLRTALIASTALCLLGLAACGGTEEEKRLRGLQTEPEVAVPVDAMELNETEAERQKQNLEELGGAERKNFDQ